MNHLVLKYAGKLNYAPYRTSKNQQTNNKQNSQNNFSGLNHTLAHRVEGVTDGRDRVVAACREAQDGRAPEVMAGHKATVIRSEAVATDLAWLSRLNPSITSREVGGANGG